MDNLEWIDVGVAGVVIFGILKILESLKGWIPALRGPAPKEKQVCVNNDRVLQMASQINDLHGWLGRRDDSGAFPWAVRPVLEALTDILREMKEQQEQANRNQATYNSALTTLIDKIDRLQE